MEITSTAFQQLEKKGFSRKELSLSLRPQAN